jgi:hypothetical protein
MAHVLLPHHDLLLALALLLILRFPILHPNVVHLIQLPLYLL